MHSGASRRLRELTYTALASALIAVSALITVPTPSSVAITLQTFGVYFALFFLGGKLGTLAVALYIAIGAVGLPVFSGFSGGVGRLLDATGGYIFGFLVCALVYWLITFAFGERLRIAAAAISLLSLYATGSLWYLFVYLGFDGGFFSVLLTCAVPFILPDVIKITLALVVSNRLARVMKNARKD